MRSKTRHLARRSRATMIWTVAFIVGVQVVGGLLLDYRWPFTRFPSAGAVLERAAQQPAAPDILFLGSSRTGTAIQETEANRLLQADAGEQTPLVVFNASLPAGDSIANELLLERLLAHGTRPRWIVLELMPEMVQKPAPWLPEHSARQLNWEHLFSHGPDVVRARGTSLYAESRLIPLYTHRKQILREANEWVQHQRTPKVAAGPRQTPQQKAALNWDELIRAPQVTATEELLEASRAGAAYYTRRWLRNYRIEGVAPEALERLLATCQREQIEVILLGVPATTVQRAEYTSEIEAVFQAYVTQLCEQFNCRYVDGRTWTADALFLDHTHVRGETGGLYFTRRLTEQVLRKLR